MANDSSYTGPKSAAASTGPQLYSSRGLRTSAGGPDASDAKFTSGKRGRRQALLWRILLHIMGALAISYLIQRCKQAKEELLLQDIVAFARALLHGEEKSIAEQMQLTSSDEMLRAQDVGERTSDHSEERAVEEPPDEGAGGPGSTHQVTAEASSVGSTGESGPPTGGGGPEQDAANENNEESKGGRDDEAADDTAGGSTATAWGSSDKAAQDRTGAGSEPTGQERDEKTEAAASADTKTGGEVTDQVAKDMSGAGSETAGEGDVEATLSTTSLSTDIRGGRGGDEKAQDEAGFGTKTQQEASGEKASDEEPGASVDVQEEVSAKAAEDKRDASSETEQQASDLNSEGETGASSETDEEEEDESDEGSDGETNESSEIDEESSGEVAADREPKASSQREQSPKEEGAADKKPSALTETQEETSENDADVKPGAITGTEQERSDEMPKGETGASSDTDEDEDEGEGSVDETDESSDAYETISDEESSASSETKQETSGQGVRPGASAETEQESGDDKSEGETDASFTTDDEEEDDDEGSGDETDESSDADGEAGEGKVEAEIGAALKTAGGGSDEATGELTSTRTNEAAESTGKESKAAVKPVPAPRAAKSPAGPKGIDVNLLIPPPKPPRALKRTRELANERTDEAADSFGRGSKAAVKPAPGSRTAKSFASRRGVNLKLLIPPRKPPRAFERTRELANERTDEAADSFGRESNATKKPVPAPRTTKSLAGRKGIDLKLLNPLPKPRRATKTTRDLTNGPTDEAAESFGRESKAAVKPVPAPRTAKSFASRKGIDLKLMIPPPKPPRATETLDSIVSRGFSDRMIARVKAQRHRRVYQMLRQAAERVNNEYDEAVRKGGPYATQWFEEIEDDVFFE
ncbi:hypothetical protein Emag_002386 [Eimeria magna]